MVSLTSVSLSMPRFERPEVVTEEEPPVKHVIAKRLGIVFNFNKPAYPFFAIDLIEGHNYKFLGDAVLEKDDFLRNFHIQPSRVLHRIEREEALPISKAFSDTS